MHRPDQFIPELIVRGGLAALDFYKSAFGAEEVHRMIKPGSEKLMHGELILDGHKFFVCDEFPASEGGNLQVAGVARRNGRAHHPACGRCGRNCGAPKRWLPALA